MVYRTDRHSYTAQTAAECLNMLHQPALNLFNLHSSITHATASSSAPASCFSLMTSIRSAFNSRSSFSSIWIEKIGVLIFSHRTALVGSAAVEGQSLFEIIPVSGLDNETKLVYLSKKENIVQ